MDDSPRLELVTLARYRQLRNRMTYADTARVLGGAGTPRRSFVAGAETVTYKWAADGNLAANVKVAFRNDLLVFKEQFGLK